MSQADRAVLIGGSVADTLIAGQHVTLTGGLGADKFEFTMPGSAATPDIDTITDFAHGADKIGVSNSGFALGLGGSFPQPLPASLFVANSTGSFTNSTQRFAYDTTSGTLVYGSSGVSPTGVHDLVATLSSHPTVPTVTAADLFVVA